MHVATEGANINSNRAMHPLIMSVVSEAMMCVSATRCRLLRLLLSALNFVAEYPKPSDENMAIIINVFLIVPYSPNSSLPSIRATATPAINDNPLPMAEPASAQNESLARRLLRRRRVMFCSVLMVL